ncbi:MAG: TonB-dependent receptor plug domain-containing protein, partial [Prevotella sp.]|nr:TonB-dependent receptor plug domain-containing protein [Prevotella sp.]
MKRYYILLMSTLLMLGLCQPILAQDDDYEEVEVATVAKKKTPAKRPTYPMMEVKGKVIDAATKAPLAGIQVQTLNDRYYAAMTDEQGEFTISVPTFASALYVFAPRYLAQQVGIGDNTKPLTITMIADKFKAMYENSTDITASSTATFDVTTSQSVETEIEGQLGADVHTITRSGGPGYGGAMFIRGLNSLNANAQPLVVIDGVIHDMQETRNTLHIGDYTNLLLNINPDDIEKVQVLKNAASIYG